MSQHFLRELVGIFPLTMSLQKHYTDMHSPLHECDRWFHLFTCMMQMCCLNACSTTDVLEGLPFDRVF